MTIQLAQEKPDATQAKVADMTTGELQAMFETLIDRKLSEWIGDPDAGLALRPEIIAGIERHRQEFAAGKRGKSLAELAQEYEAD